MEPHPDLQQQLDRERAQHENTKAALDWEVNLKKALLPYQERAVRAEQRIKELERLIQEFANEMHLLGVRLANSAMTPEALEMLLHQNRK